MNTGEKVLEFAIRGTADGKNISATKGLPFLRFADFNADVQAYLRGSDKPNALRPVEVAVEEGSYKLRVIIPVGILLSLFSDSEKVARTKCLDGVDPHRAKIISKWQKKSVAESTMSFEVSSPTEEFPPIEITPQTSFTQIEKAQLVKVERYIIGKVIDMGGANDANIHIRPRNSTDIIIVQASADQIEAQQESVVYKTALLHVHAKQNLKTGDLGDYSLIDVRRYQPKVDEGELREMFAKGEKAWGNVARAGEWVEKLRSESHG